MSAPNSPANAVLEALGFALFLRDDAGALRLHGAPPAWLVALWPGLTNQAAPLPVTEASPFLENFLIDAEETWAAGGKTRVNSGPWIEQNNGGEEVSLEATALTVEGAAALLLERLGEVFEAKKGMLQKARETVIAYQRLNSETQKKEVLLSCIAEEMNAALGNAVTALRLIEMEKHSPRAQQLLSLAMRATEDQQALINKVLNVFAAELEDLYGRAGDSSAETSLGEVLPRVKKNLGGSFEEKQVQLNLPPAAANEWRLAMHCDHLTRILASLLQNALENAPAGSAVSLEATDDSDAVRLKVTDTGEPLPPSVGNNLFSREVLSLGDASALQMRLQFCRVAIEKNGGELGYESRPQGGNSFWLRLPKPAAGRE